MRTWIDVAQLVKMRNLDGSFVVQSTAGLPFLLEEGSKVAFVPPQTDAVRDATVSSVQFVDDRKAYVRFAEVQDAEAARLIVGSHCLIRRSDLPDNASMIATGGIEGWTVQDINEGLLGTVSDVIENPGQNLLEVQRADGSTLLIPLVDEFIAEVDEEACTISVDVPAGLTDL